MGKGYRQLGQAARLRWLDLHRAFWGWRHQAVAYGMVGGAGQISLILISFNPNPPC